MRRSFTATVLQEGDWYVAQCLEVDVASQGETEDEAVANLREALELHFEEPRATSVPKVRRVQIKYLPPRGLMEEENHARTTSTLQ